MKKLHAYISLILVTGIFSANFSLAVTTLDRDKCSTEDVSAALGPLRNQGNIGWCYANVAADLMTFRHQKKLKGQQASAGYIAITFNQFIYNRPNDDAGLVSPAVVFSQLDGVCPQSFQEIALAKSPFKTIREQIDALVKLKEEFNKEKKAGRNFADSKLLQTYQESDSYLNLLKNEELFSILENSTVRTFPRKLVNRLCAPYKTKVNPDLKIRFQTGFIEGWKHSFPEILKANRIERSKILGRNDLIQEIHEEISKKNMIAVSYDTRIFYDAETAATKKPGLHASSIVGRKWNDKTQTCDFKLRNSWGKNCSAYTNPDLKQNCEADTGYLWIPDTLLWQTVADIIYYKVKSQSR